MTVSETSLPHDRLSIARPTQLRRRLQLTLHLLDWKWGPSLFTLILDGLTKSFTGCHGVRETREGLSRRGGTGPSGEDSLRGEEEDDKRRRRRGQANSSPLFKPVC